MLNILFALYFAIASAFAGSWFFVKSGSVPIQFSNADSCNFDGSNDYIDFGNIFDNDGTKAMTLAFIAKSAGFDLNEGADVFAKNDASGTWAGYAFGFFNSGGTTYLNSYISANISSDYIGLQKAGVWTADTWQWWMMTYPGDKQRASIKRYRNGSLITSETDQGNSSMTGSSSNSISFNIGTRNNLGSGVWNYKGKLAQIFVMFDTAVCDATCAAEWYNSGSVLDLNSFSRKADVDAYWQCASALTPADSDTGTLYDRKGSFDGSTENTGAGFIDSDNP